MSKTAGDLAEVGTFFCQISSSHKLFTPNIIDIVRLEPKISSLYWPFPTRRSK